ncbi:thioredoxin family protein [Fibrella aquatica]|uniref:thioredoxin family protein n=1 Tax=Fibrella aquatica TaxID=3242487 RepID=UPI00351FD5CB
MRLSALFLVLLLVGFFPAFRPATHRFDTKSPVGEGKKINWISFKEAHDLNQKAPRKIIIDVYTGWCGWCKVMDQKTFSQPAIIDYVNDHFYAVKLDAEQAADITVGGQTFRKQGNVHELAASLLQGKMSYPSTVFLDEKMAMIQPIAGYLEARMFHQIITYFGGNYQTKEAFDAFKAGTYVKEFQPAMPTPATGK